NPRSLAILILRKSSLSDFEQGKQTIDFIISESLIRLIVSGLQADCTYGNEIQLRVWRYLNNREEGSENIYLCVELNGKPRYVHQPSPNFIYITSDCVLEPNVRNRISISSPRQEILQNYAFGLAIVKRIFPEEVLEKYPLRRTDDTLMLDMGIELRTSKLKWGDAPSC
ncbi:uncharacterized protein CEXT_660011, partial [Caerostris extrusa]